MGINSAGRARVESGLAHEGIALEGMGAGRQKPYHCKVERLGRIQSLPAFDPKSFETAVKDATGCERAAAHSL